MFVAILSASNYTYAKMQPSQDAMPSKTLRIFLRFWMITSINGHPERQPDSHCRLASPATCSGLWTKRTEEIENQPSILDRAGCMCPIVSIPAPAATMATQ